MIMVGKIKTSKMAWKLSMESAAEVSVIEVYFSGMETLLCLLMHDLPRQGKFLPPIFFSLGLDRISSPSQQVMEEGNSC